MTLWHEPASKINFELEDNKIKVDGIGSFKLKKQMTLIQGVQAGRNICCLAKLSEDKIVLLLLKLEHKTDASIELLDLKCSDDEQEDIRYLVH